MKASHAEAIRIVRERWEQYSHQRQKNGPPPTTADLLGRVAYRDITLLCTLLETCHSKLDQTEDLHHDPDPDTGL